MRIDTESEIILREAIRPAYSELIWFPEYACVKHRRFGQKTDKRVLFYRLAFDNRIFLAMAEKHRGDWIEA